MSTYEKFKNSDKLETEGIWLDYGDFRIKIARAGGSNKAFTKTLEKQTRRFRRALETGTASDDMVRPAYVRTLAKTVILTWEGVTDENGEPLPFSEENAIKLLNDLPDLYKDIHDQANKGALFRAALLEEDAGN